MTTKSLQQHKKKRGNLTPANLADAGRLLALGETVTDIAKQLDIGRSALSHAIQPMKQEQAAIAKAKLTKDLDRISRQRVDKHYQLEDKLQVLLDRAWTMLNDAIDANDSALALIAQREAKDLIYRIGSNGIAIASYCKSMGVTTVGGSTDSSNSPSVNFISIFHKKDSDSDIPLTNEDISSKLKELSKHIKKMNDLKENAIDADIEILD